MSRHSGIAITASAAVIVMTVLFYTYAVTREQGPEAAHYELQAVFLSSNGLHVGGDVRLAGVTIGTVSSITLDPVAFVTHVGFHIDDRYRLPSDTALGIGSSSFTSANGLLIDPGRSKRTLAPGEIIRDTHEMVSLEQAVSQYIFGAGGLGNSTGP